MHKRIVTALLGALGLGILVGGTAEAQTPIVIAQSAEGCRLSIVGKNLIAEGCNLHVRDASGTTECAGTECNNTGNVIIGWNNAYQWPNTPPQPQVTTGNHNLVLGTHQSYSGYGGIVSGRTNTIAGENAVAIGGVGNDAAGDGSCVVGGVGNEATGDGSVVVGGEKGSSEGWTAGVFGGYQNTAIGDRNAVFGGSTNEASGGMATAVGGVANISSGTRSTMLGGVGNECSGTWSTLVGGQDRLSVTDYSAVVGGNTTDRVPMPYNNGSSTTIAANSSYGPHHISFGMTLPCVPDVVTTTFNSGTGQLAPFVVSINNITETGFDYYLVNPASTTRSAYTASIVYSATCQ